MAFPVPKPGLVIRYGFLWSHEADAGAEDAAKDRPCAVVLAATRGANGEITTIVAPITHTPPGDPLDSVKIPATLCRKLGLDGERHWLRIDELKRFAWPGYDLRPIPGRTGAFAYGMLPPGLFEHLRAAILERQKAKTLKVQGRD